METPSSLNISAVSEELKQFMKARGLGNENIGREIGYSSATISRFIGGDYPGDVRTIAIKVTNFLEREKQKASLPSSDIIFTNTSTAQEIFYVARLAHRRKKICLIHGDPGCGKTLAVKEYNKKNSGTVLIEADLSISPRSLFEMLHKELKLSEFGKVHDMFMEAVDRLKGTNRLIIIDEAEHLPYKALELVRRLADKAEVGILLSGTGRLVKHLRGRRGEHAQLYSRIYYQHQVSNLSAADARLIINENLPEADNLWEVFYTYCKKNTRILGNLMDLSKIMMEEHKQPISEDLIAGAASAQVIQ